MKVQLSLFDGASPRSEAPVTDASETTHISAPQFGVFIFGSAVVWIVGAAVAAERDDGWGDVDESDAMAALPSAAVALALTASRAVLWDAPTDAMTLASHALRAVAVFIAVYTVATPLNRRARYIAAASSATSVALQAAVDMCDVASLLVALPIVTSLASVLRGSQWHGATTEQRERTLIAVGSAFIGLCVAWVACAAGVPSVRAWGDVVADAALLLSVV